MNCAGVLASLQREEIASNPITEVVNAAIAIRENFSGIFLPGLQETHPTLRLGLHTGTILLLLCAWYYTIIIIIILIKNNLHYHYLP